MRVAILGRSKWEWGKGDVIVIRIDDRCFAQCEECEDQDDADEIKPDVAMDLLNRRGAKLTSAGRAWMKEQRALWAKYELLEKRICSSPDFNGIAAGVAANGQE